MSRFKDVEHLLRLALVFGVGIIAFAILRTLLVPNSFGEYGHYRGNAIAETAAQPLRFAGHQACEACHSDILEIKNAGKHAGVNCEACHGPASSHAEDPGAVQPPKLSTKILCTRCHEVNGARPKSFPQIVTKEHNAGDLPCETCHQPHSPLLVPGAKP